MQDNKIERPLMSESEFTEYLKNTSPVISDFGCVSKFRSAYRAMRRGHISISGLVAPKRPFNNRTNTSSRKGVHSRVTNELKKTIYASYRSK